MKQIWSSFSQPSLINNADVLKMGQEGGIRMNASLCINLDSNFLFSNFRKVKINSLWVPGHQKGTARCFVLRGNSEFMDYKLPVYVWKERSNYQRALLFWTQVYNIFRHGFFFNLVRETNIEKPSNLNILRLENSPYLIFINLGVS